MYDELVKRLRASVDGRYEKCDGCPYEEDYPCCVDCLDKMHKQAADAIEELSRDLDSMNEANIALYGALPKWIPVTERLPECDPGAEVGNIEWICCRMVHAGCFGRGGKYRDAYFRTWTDAGEGMDAKDADYWRAVTLPQPPKVDFVKSQIRGGLSMKAKYGINPISGGEKMNCANDPVTVLPESELLSATIKCGGTVTCKEYDDPTIKCGGTATCVVSKKEDE